jgi:hypothetical protein
LGRFREGERLILHWALDAVHVMEHET